MLDNPDPSSLENQEWYYVSASNERQGPWTFGEIRDLIAQGKIHSETQVWTSGWTEWVAAGTVEELTSTAGQNAPAPSSAEAVGAPAAGQAPKQQQAEELPAAAPMELKPRQGNFMFGRVMGGFALSLLLTALVTFILFTAELSPWLALLLLVPSCAVSVYAALVAYRKERYEIHDHRVLCHRGGLFRDETTELELRNVTHLLVKRPWLRHKFFGIGHVLVESAGISKPIVLFALHQPMTIYDELRERLKKNGFELHQTELLHEESPAMAGIILELLGLLSGLAAFFLFFFSMIMSGYEQAEASGWLVPYATFIGLTLLVALAFITIRILDLRRRVYRVYDDVVVYEEGFLTRENAFIPYENIADASTKRTFLDQIFGIFDVNISCQGSSSEIKFRRLRRGEALSDAIDQLVTAASRKPKWKPAPTEVASAKLKPRRSEPDVLHSGIAITGEFKMDAKRMFLPLLILLPLFPIWVVAMIGAGIWQVCTTYSLRSGSLRHHFSFLTTNVREFAYDKVTGVTVKRNLWDRLFNTMTLKFWSIGSGQAMEFLHLKCDAFDLASLMRQLGIPPASGQPYQADVKFRFGTWVRAGLKHLPLVLILTAAAWGAAYYFEIPMIGQLFMLLLVAVAIISLIHGALYYGRQTLSFHEHHVEAMQGIISKRHYHVCYRNIKRRKVTLYPGRAAGSLEIFVAGEEQSNLSNAQQTKDNRVNGLPRQCAFRTGFLIDALEVGKLLDDILCGRNDAAPDAVSADALEVLLEAPRAVKNAIIRLVLLSVLLFPLLPLLPFSLAWTAVAIKRWRYKIDLARIVIRRGVFYHTEETTLLDRVDSLKQNQGPVHLLCGNGDVSIMTAGSSKPDLIIQDCPDFRKVYELIRDNSQ